MGDFSFPFRPFFPSFHSYPFCPIFLHSEPAPATAREFGGALKLLQWARAEPDRETTSGASWTEKVLLTRAVLVSDIVHETVIIKWIHCISIIGRNQSVSIQKIIKRSQISIGAQH